MPKPRASPAKPAGRLKVFMTQIGFHNWLVAARSQKAALEAWDVRENLFANGSAKVVTDPDCVALAMKTPGVPVAVDAEHALAKATNVLRLQEHRARRPAKAASKREKPKVKRRPKADRSKLDSAEDALEAFRKRALRERSAILRAQKELDLRIEALEAELDEEQERLEAAVEKARARYEAELNP
jgi:hypothetical protein